MLLLEDVTVESGSVFDLARSVKFQDVNGQAVPLVLPAHGVDLLNLWESQPRSVTVKARQVFVTQTLLLYVLHKMLVRPTKIMASTPTLDHTQELMRRLLFMFDSLPKSVKGKYVREHKWIESADRIHGYYQVAIWKLGERDRSCFSGVNVETVQKNHLDEADIVIRDECSFFGYQSPETVLYKEINVSTNRSGSEFEMQVIRALKGQNGFTPHLVPARVRPPQGDLSYMSLKFRQQEYPNTYTDALGPNWWLRE